MKTIVTGASSGIGAAIADLLEAQGQSVIRVDIRGSDVWQMDVTDSQAWSRLVSSEPAISGLVNAAGIKRFGAINEVEDDDIAAVLDTNVRGSILGMRAVSRQMISQAVAGSIVNISSLVAERTPPGQIVYNTAKGAVSAATKSAAADLAMHNIRVNAVSPGSISTPMTASGWIEAGAADRKRMRIPMRRQGQPIEVAHVVHFLLSDRASYVTGSVWPVDGGWAGAGI